MYQMLHSVWDTVLKIMYYEDLFIGLDGHIWEIDDGKLYRAEDDRYISMPYSTFDDKNGTKIFAGDIIKYQCGMNSFKLYEVIFLNGKFHAKAWQWGQNWNPFSKAKCEVIGNKFKNPELLDSIEN